MCAEPWEWIDCNFRRKVYRVSDGSGDPAPRSRRGRSMSVQRDAESAKTRTGARPNVLAREAHQFYLAP
jgi:hypothetical protein